LPNGRYKPHPIVVISNSAVKESEGVFYGLMVSTKKYNEEFLFELKPGMTTQNIKFPCYVKCQLIQAYEEFEIMGRYGKVKAPYFNKLLKKLFDSVFKPI